MRYLLALCLLTSVAIGQVTTANITGTVTDSSGGAIAGATVVATNVETNFSRTATTMADGSYNLQFMPIGRYKIEISATGFKKSERTGVVLEVNVTTRFDASLQVGAVTETVEVTASAPVVETTQPAIGLTVTNADIENLPLVNRDVYTLLTLTPGVDNTESASDNFGAPMQSTIVNGSPNSGIGSVNYSLDGGSNTSGLRNTGNVPPNPDAIQEFRVITNSYPADQGRFGGGTVTMVTKSGTNSFHGSLFEFLRNDDLNANRWVPGGSSLGKDPLHRNQFGGTLGGRIVRDRTFFFGSYSGLRERTTYFANTATPLTAAERMGDLSASGGTAPIDPQTGVAFPNRQIPVSRFDPVTVRLLNEYIPLPNLADGRYEVTLPHPKNSNEYLGKIDHRLNDLHNLTGSFFHTRGDDLTGLFGNLAWVQRSFDYKQYNYNVTETWTVSPTKVNEFRVSYIRNFGGRINTPALSLGDLGSKFQIQGPPSLPQIQVAGRFNLNSQIPGPVAGSNLYQVRDLLSINTGRHNIKIGGEGILEKMIHDTLLNNYGTFTFNTNNTTRGTRNATADFLLGFPTTMNQDAPTTKINNSWYWALFIQDDFRVALGLTLNLGLRWDIQSAITDPLDRFAAFVPGRQSRIVPTAPVGLLFPGDDGVQRGIIGTQWKNLSPRIGIAWDPFGNGKTAIRAAAGVFYGSISGNEWNSSSDNQPFAIRQQFNNVYSLSDPYRLLPGGVSPFPYSYSPAAPRFIAPSAIVAIDLDYKLPYFYQMNFAIEREIFKDTRLTVAYVNNLGHRIPAVPDVNYPLLTATATTANVDARRPYLPNVLGRIGVTKSILNSAYHGLQVQGDKRLSKSFMIKGYYTFGKGIDSVNTQNSTLQQATDWNNIRLDRGRTNFDRTHNTTLSGIWMFNYLKDASPVLKAIANGWSVAAIGTFRSGQPLTITNGADVNFDGTNNDRPDLIGNPYLDPDRPRSQVVAQWFNTAAFARTNDRSRNFAGTAGRNILDGPGIRTIDMTLAREFRMWEKTKLQFRAEATNAFNMVSLSNPGTNVNAPATLGIITTARPMRQVQMGLKLTF